MLPPSGRVAALASPSPRPRRRRCRLRVDSAALASRLRPCVRSAHFASRRSSCTYLITFRVDFAAFGSRRRPRVSFATTAASTLPPSRRFRRSCVASPPLRQIGPFCVASQLLHLFDYLSRRFCRLRVASLPSRFLHHDRIYVAALASIPPPSRRVAAPASDRRILRRVAALAPI